MKPIVVAAFSGLLACPVKADRLRISPDDLRLRVAVSEELSPAIRRELKELARSAPLPVKDGVVQSEELFSSRFGERDWRSKKVTLARYYFLVARLEQSQSFSDEFLRRETLLKQADGLLSEYIDTLNAIISRAVYTDAPKVRAEKIQEFPLTEVEGSEDGSVLSLRKYPAPKQNLGRNNLRELRHTAQAELQQIRERRKMLQEAENDFLGEASQLGSELLRMRARVRELVKVPGEGLPFSP